MTKEEQDDKIIKAFKCTLKLGIEKFPNYVEVGDKYIENSTPLGDRFCNLKYVDVYRLKPKKRFLGVPYKWEKVKTETFHIVVRDVLEFKTIITDPNKVNELKVYMEEQRELIKKEKELKKQKELKAKQSVLDKLGSC